MESKCKTLYMFVCTMLFVITFTSVTAFADTGDIVNETYLGTYKNSNDDRSYFTIINGSDHPISAIKVYAKMKDKIINGSGDMVQINSAQFSAHFSKAREVDKNGILQGDYWLTEVILSGSVSNKLVWFNRTIVVTMTEGTEYVKS